jgi:mono/diheme cytochrome c family protein
MRRVLKWIGLILGGLIALVLVVTVASFAIAGQRLGKTYEITPEAIPIPDQVTASRDEWPLMLVDFCQDCHGPALSGQVLEDDPLVGRLVASNLTAGKGGKGATNSDADFVRGLRHGVAADGRSLLFMPSQSIGRLSDRDLGEIIAYVKSMPPIDNELPPSQLRPVGRLMFLAGGIPGLLPAEIIDHDATRRPEPVPGPTAEYGQYLSFICDVCHTEDLSGGPGAGEGMNLTPGGELANWSEEDFIETMRTGFAPDGEVLDSEQMPSSTFSKFSDMELRAIWLYLQSLPAIETEHR